MIEITRKKRGPTEHYSINYEAIYGGVYSTERTRKKRMRRKGFSESTARKFWDGEEKMTRQDDFINWVWENHNKIVLEYIQSRK